MKRFFSIRFLSANLSQGSSKAGGGGKTRVSLGHFSLLLALGSWTSPKRRLKDMPSSSILSGAPARLYRQTISRLRPVRWSTDYGS